MISEERIRIAAEEARAINVTLARLIEQQKRMIARLVTVNATYEADRQAPELLPPKFAHLRHPKEG